MNIFSIAPPRLGGMDMLLPLFIEIKLRFPSAEINLIFKEIKTFSQLQRDKFLRDETNRIVDHITVLESSETAFFENMRLSRVVEGMAMVWRLLSVALSLFLKSNPVLFHSQSLESVWMRVLRLIVNLKNGCIIGHPNGLVFRPGFENINAKKIKEVYGDAYMGFRTLDVSSWYEQDREKYIQIGFTRLYRSWKERIHKKSHSLIDEELIRLGRSPDQEFIVVFLPSTVGGIFGWDELVDWISSIIKKTRLVYGDTFIILKPHPTLNIDRLNQSLNDINDENLGISYLHSGMLAVSARLVISHHSSVIIDALAAGVPTIQFQRFTPHWLGIHPEGSAFLALQPLWAQSEDELELSLIAIQRGEWVVPELEKLLGHKESLEKLFKLLNSQGEAIK